jgi:hypothetical protein
MNTRVYVHPEIGTVRYEGPLLHKPSDPNDIWIGIEWDNPHRGKHSGTVEDTTYFRTASATGGSLVRKAKADFGLDIITSLQKRYFRNNSDWRAALEILEDNRKVQEQIKALEDEELQKQEASKKEEFKKLVSEQKKTIELEEDAYFSTVKNSKIQVEFCGFLDIWRKINDLQNLKHLSLCS